MSTQKMETIYESAKETAKKIRTALKATFPNTKFSVTSKVFSGGDSVYIRWTDLPLTEDVQAIISKFESGHYNGYEDIYESGSYEYEGKHYNGAKYIQTSRNMSDEYKEKVNEYLNLHYGHLNLDSWELNRFFNQAEKEMIEEAKQPLKVEVVENNSTVENADSLTVELNINEEKKGIELKFSGIPTEGTRQLLKDNKFRWSKYNKVWFTKQTENALLFAESFVSAFNDTFVEVETITTVEETTTNEPVEAGEVTEELTPVYTNENKIKVKSIMFIWSESNVITDNTIVNTFAEAENLIKQAAFNAPDDGCYDKTKFKIVWTDGQDYTGRIDIVKADSFKIFVCNIN